MHKGKETVYMKKKLLAMLTSVALIASLLAGCGGGGNSQTDLPADNNPPTASTGSPESENVLRIGALFNQTGWFAVYDYNNVLEMQCLAKMYNDQGGIDIGGTKYIIEIVAQDGQSDVEGIRSAAQLLADAGVNYLVETNDFWVEGALDIFENAGIMNIMSQNNMSFATINKDYNYAYTFSNGAASQYAAAFEIFKTNYPEVKKVVYCCDDNGINDAQAALVESLCAKYGMEYIDAPVVFDAESTDFSAIALQLLGTGADAFIGNGAIANTGSIIKELRNNGSNMVVAATIGSNASVLKEACGLEDITGVFTLGSDLANPENNTDTFNRLYDTFKAEYGDDVASAWSGVSVNCLYTLLQIMQTVGTVDVAEVQAYLESADTAESLFGTANICGTETYGVKHLIAHPNPSTLLVDGEVVFGGLYECYVP